MEMANKKAHHLWQHLGVTHSNTVKYITLVGLQSFLLEVGKRNEEKS